MWNYCHSLLREHIFQMLKCILRGNILRRLGHANYAKFSNLDDH